MNIPTHFKRFAFFLVLFEISVYLSVDAFLPALPYIAQHFAHSSWPISYTLSSWFLGTTLMQLLIGPITEHCGYRNTLLAGVLVFIAASILCVCTQRMAWFLLGRVLQGGCVASIHAPGYGTLHNILKQKDAIRTTAWMNAIAILAPAAGPMLGAGLLLWGHWQWIFITIALSAALAGIGLFSDTPKVNVDNNPEHRNLKARMQQYARVLRAPAYLRLKLGQCCLFAYMIAWIATTPMLLMQHFGFSPTGYAWAQALVFGAFITGTQLVKQLINRWEPSVFLKVTVNLPLVAAVLSTLACYSQPDAPWFLIAATATLALGNGMSGSSLDRLSIECSQEPMAMRVALGSFLFASFGFLGSLAGGWLPQAQLLPLALLLLTLTACASLLIFSRGIPAHGH